MDHYLQAYKLTIELGISIITAAGILVALYLIVRAQSAKLKIKSYLVNVNNDERLNTVCTYIIRTDAVNVGRIPVNLDGFFLRVGRIIFPFRRPLVGEKDRFPRVLHYADTTYLNCLSDRMLSMQLKAYIKRSWIPEYIWRRRLKIVAKCGLDLFEGKVDKGLVDRLLSKEPMMLTKAEQDNLKELLKITDDEAMKKALKDNKFTAAREAIADLPLEYFMNESLGFSQDEHARIKHLYNS